MKRIILCTLFAAGCTTPPPVTVCPSPVPYSAAIQARAADELSTLPADAVLRGMMADYIRERDQLRVVGQ